MYQLPTSDIALWAVDLSLVRQTSVALSYTPIQLDMLIYTWLAVGSRLAIWSLEPALWQDRSFCARPGLNLRSKINCVSALSAPDFPLLWKIQGIGGTIPY